MKSKILIGLLALGLAFNSFATDYTLKNLKQHVRFEKLANGGLIPHCATVKDYSEVEQIVKATYEKVTGKEMNYKIIILSKNTFDKKMKHSEVLDVNRTYGGIAYGNSICLKEDLLTQIFNRAGHELGHLTGGRFTEQELVNCYKKRIVEESRAIAFNVMWNLELRKHLGTMLDPTNWEEEDKLYITAENLFFKLYDAKNPRSAYEALSKKPIEELIALVKDTEQYKKYEKEEKLFDF